MRQYNIYVVVGSAFGDEGKGRHTDYLSEKYESLDTIVIRYNGGAQAGHTVQLSDGRRHVFSHFGSGSLIGISTYLSEDFICNPIVFREEYDSLEENFRISPSVIIDSNAMFTIPSDMIINQAIETIRGSDRHGSCCLGINETVLRYKSNILKHPKLAEVSLSELQNYIDEVLQVYVPNRLKDLGISIKDLPENFRDHLYNKNIIDRYIEDFRFMRGMSRCAGKSYIAKWFRNLIFEGAQGLMLDELNESYAPNLTTSRTGTTNVSKFISYINELYPDSEFNVEVNYLVRTYMTRHGAGRFDSEVSSRKAIPGHVYDTTNVDNEWQGPLRYGYLDIDQISDYINRDYGDLLISTQNIDNILYSKNIVVGHADQVGRGSYTLAITDGIVYCMKVMDILKEFRKTVRWDTAYISTSPYRLGTTEVTNI